MKTRSILPNSSPEILKPTPHRDGVLQVLWLKNLDAHGLFWQKGESQSLLATHHNGHSCHSLGKRIVSGKMQEVTDQAEYIRICGGTTIGDKFLAYLTEPA